MIINESGLVRALKNAFKREGYTILGNQEQLTIYTELWYIRADWNKIPRKVLAAIVEHLGMLPAAGEALLVSARDETQMAIPEVVGQDIDTFENGTMDGAVTIVPVTVGALQLYQEEGGGRCYGVDHICLGIIERGVAIRNAADVTRDCRVRWNHDGEFVAMKAYRATDAYWEKQYERDIWKAMESVDLHKREE